MVYDVFPKKCVRGSVLHTSPVFFQRHQIFGLAEGHLERHGLSPGSFCNFLKFRMHESRKELLQPVQIVEHLAGCRPCSRQVALLASDHSALRESPYLLIMTIPFSIIPHIKDPSSFHACALLPLAGGIPDTARLDCGGISGGISGCQKGEEEAEPAVTAHPPRIETPCLFIHVFLQVEV